MWINIVPLRGIRLRRAPRDIYTRFKVTTSIAATDDVYASRDCALTQGGFFAHRCCYLS
jgi:hypothetical protein